MRGVKLMRASAGSGKTYQLAYEYVRTVIAEPMEYRHILAVTFTNKATEEMKRRILQEINELAVGGESDYLGDLQRDLKLSSKQIAQRATLARTKILHDYSRFAILTIDKFFQRIIRSFIKELGIDLNFNLELQTDTLLSSAADMMIDQITVDESLKRWIISFVEERIEENRQWDIRRGLTGLGSEVFKERYKQASRHIESKEELGKIVNLLSQKASALKSQMQQLGQEGVDTMTEHGLVVGDFLHGRNSVANHFVKFAEERFEAAGKRVSDTLLSDNDRDWHGDKERKDDILEALPKLRSLLEQMTALYEQSKQFINSTELMRQNYRNFALLSDLSEQIEQICVEDNIMPISQTNEILYKLISGNDTPFIFEKVGNHFNRFMIDEFQDTSTMQWENFVPLLHNALAQSEESPVLLVGDVKQSIYRWRGGDWRILASQISDEFSEVVKIDLTTNYRSLRNIVEFNNAIIGACVANDNEALNKELDEALQAKVISKQLYAELHDMLKLAYANHAQKSRYSENEGYITLTYYGRDEELGYIPPVIEKVEELQERGYAPGDIAILVRSNSQGVDLANMLLKHKSENPDSKYSYDVVTQEALEIGSSPVAAFIIASLKLSANLEDSLSRAVYNRYKGYDLDRRFEESERVFLSSIQFRTPGEAFEELVMEHRLNDREENIAYLQALHEQIITFSSKRISDIELFVSWWEESGSTQSITIPQGSTAINITTIHKSKGLQYKAVIIPYCNWSLTPRSNSIVWAEGSEEFSNFGQIPVQYKKQMGESHYAESYYSELIMTHVDNINVFYVATTRAEEELHIMMPENSTRGKSLVSRLIAEAITLTDKRAALGEMEGIVERFDDKTSLITFGKPVVGQSAAEADLREGIISSNFGTFHISDRLRLRFSKERYLDDGVTDYTISPRHYGLLMHRVFEDARGVEDIERSLNKMVQNGLISSAEEKNLNQIIAQAFDNSQIKSWFDDSWEIIRNENDIIIPPTAQLDGSTRRPDRVMTRDDSAVIIDYKFGLNRLPEHSKQVREYAGLLKEMGYSDVKGYIWYVSLSDVEPVVI